MAQPTNVHPSPRDEHRLAGPAATSARCLPPGVFRPLRASEEPLLGDLCLADFWGANRGLAFGGSEAGYRQRC